MYTAFTSTRITDIPEPKCLVYRIYSFVCALWNNDTISLCNVLLKNLQAHHNTEYSKEFSIVIKFAWYMWRSVAKNGQVKQTEYTLVIRIWYWHSYFNRMCSGELRTQNIPPRIERSVLRPVLRSHTEYEVNFKIFHLMTSLHCRNSLAQTAW